jgi:hypothetical protein
MDGLDPRGVAFRSHVSFAILPRQIRLLVSLWLFSSRICGPDAAVIVPVRVSLSHCESAELVDSCGSPGVAGSLSHFAAWPAPQIIVAVRS